MIPTIGLIVAIYCIARLLLLHTEHSQSASKGKTLLVVGVLAAVAIALLAVDLITSANSNPPLPGM